MKFRVGVTIPSASNPNKPNDPVAQPVSMFNEPQRRRPRDRPMSSMIGPHMRLPRGIDRLIR